MCFAQSEMTLISALRELVACKLAGLCVNRKMYRIFFYNYDSALQPTISKITIIVMHALLKCCL